MCVRRFLKDRMKVGRKEKVYEWTKESLCEEKGNKSFKRGLNFHIQGFLVDEALKLCKY